MSRLAVLCVALALAVVAEAQPRRVVPSLQCPNPISTDLTAAKRITFKVCDNARIYQVGSDFVLVCPGQAVPRDGILMRQYLTAPR